MPRCFRPGHAAGREAKAEEVVSNRSEGNAVLCMVMGMSVPAVVAGLELDAPDSVVRCEIGAEGGDIGAHLILARTQDPAGVVAVSGLLGVPGIGLREAAGVQAYRPADEVHALSGTGFGQLLQRVRVAGKGGDVGLDDGIAVQAAVGTEVDGGGVARDQLRPLPVGAHLLEGVVCGGDADRVEADLVAQIADRFGDSVVAEIPQICPYGVVHAFGAPSETAGKDPEWLGEKPGICCLRQANISPWARSKVLVAYQSGGVYH